MGLGNEWMNESCFLLMALPVDHSENSRQLNILWSLGLLWHVNFNFSVSIFLNSPLPCPDAWQYLSARFWAEWQNVPVGSLPQLNMWSGCSSLHPSRQLTPVRRKKQLGLLAPKGLAMGESPGTWPLCNWRVLVWACFKLGGKKVFYISVIHEFSPGKKDKQSYSIGFLLVPFLTSPSLWWLNQAGQWTPHGNTLTRLLCTRESPAFLRPQWCGLLAGILGLLGGPQSS